METITSPATLSKARKTCRGEFAFMLTFYGNNGCVRNKQSALSAKRIAHSRRPATPSDAQAHLTCVPNRKASCSAVGSALFGASDSDGLFDNGLIRVKVGLVFVD